MKDKLNFYIVKYKEIMRNYETIYGVDVVADKFILITLNNDIFNINQFKKENYTYNDIEYYKLNKSEYKYYINHSHDIKVLIKYKNCYKII